MTILCTVSFSSGSENNTPDRNTKEYTWLLPAFMRSDFGTKTLAKDDWFVISPSALCISNRLFLSSAMNVKLLDLFRIARAIFGLLKTVWFVDWFVNNTANTSKFLKNVADVSLSSLDFSKTFWSVSKNLSATSKILFVISIVWSVVRIKISQRFGQEQNNKGHFVKFNYSNNSMVDVVPRLLQNVTIP